ncbi:AAWKG family protein [Streptomyces canus]|uniref:AAWKG family protein n=1 Tax=Streptomyces canus TaxID=58343 RepID=UPI0033E05758
MAIDNWEHIINLVTGWTLPERAEVTDNAKGDSGIPWLNVDIKSVSREDMNLHNEWHPDGMGATIQFWGGSGHNVSKYEANVTFANIDKGKQFWEASEFALWHLAYNNFTSLNLDAPVSGAPSAANGIDLHSFSKLAKSYDAAGDFFTKHTETLKQWTEALGDEQASWKGTAAGVFWHLVDDLHTKYENFSNELRPPGFTPSSTSPSTGYQSTTLHGDSLIGAETALHKLYTDMYSTYEKFFWQQASPIQITQADGSTTSYNSPADPRDILLNILEDITNWAAAHQASHVVMTTRSGSNGTGGNYSYDNWDTQDGYQESPHWGSLADMSTWGAIANEAVNRWKNNVSTNLDTPTIPMVTELQNAFSRVLDPNWNTKFAFDDTSTADLASEFQQEQAEAQAQDVANAAGGSSDLSGLTDPLNGLGSDVQDLNNGINSFTTGLSDSLGGLTGGGGSTIPPPSSIDTTGGGPGLSDQNSLLSGGGGGGSGSSDTSTLTSGNGDGLTDWNIPTPGDGGPGTIDPNSLTDTTSTGTGNGLNDSNSLMNSLIPPNTFTSTGKANSLTGGPTGGDTNPDGSVTTTTGNGSQLTTLPNGTQLLAPPPGSGGVTTVTNPDGSVTTPNSGGGLTTKYPDGSSQTVNSDGTVTTSDPDGQVTTSHIGSGDTLPNPDGSRTTVTTGGVTTKFPDGSSITSNADGSLTATNPDGSHTTTFPNGSSQSVDTQGRVQLKSPDGSVTTTDGSGDLTTKFPDGSSQTVHSDGTVTNTDPHGGVTTTHLGSGDTLTNPDGSKLTNDPSTGLTTHLPDGSSFTAHPDGSFTTTNADGTTTTQFPNGMVETVGQDHITHLTSPNGDVTTQNPDGSVTTDFTGGGSTTVHPDGSVTTTSNGHTLTSELNPGQSIVNPDGSTTSVDHGGGITTKFPDGSSYTLNPDGTVTTTNATGTGGSHLTTTDTTGSGNHLDTPNSLDLSKLQHSVANGLTTANGDGTTTTHFPGGSISTTEPNGLTTTHFPDGSSMVTGPNGQFQAVPSPGHDSSTDTGGSLGSTTASATGTGGNTGADSSLMNMMSPMMMMMGMARAGGQGQQGQQEGQRVRDVYADDESDGAFLHAASSGQRRQPTPVDAYEEEEEDAEVLFNRPASESSGRRGTASRPATQSSSASWSADGDVWGTDEGGLPASIGR